MPQPHSVLYRLLRLLLTAAAAAVFCRFLFRPLLPLLLAFALSGLLCRPVDVLYKKLPLPRSLWALLLALVLTALLGVAGWLLWRLAVQPLGVLMEQLPQMADRLQQALAKYNYNVTVNGTYDSDTFLAVQSFQALNGLSVDGVAGKNTLTKLYSGSCKSFPTGTEGAIYGSMGYVSAPSRSSIQLLHWVDDIKPTLSNRQAILCYDPATNISWSLTIIALGRHCDVEPSTKADTAAMNAAFTGMQEWDPKPVYVRLPSGVWTVATTHNVAHGINPIPNNDFEGQNCVHFLRDMSEAEENDPDYGVTNQKALRTFWYNFTGQNIPYK